jgi:hypothetical protein
MSAAGYQEAGRFKAADGSELVAVRARPEDIPFIVDTWARSYAAALAQLPGSDEEEAIRARLYPEIRQAIQREGCRALVAISEEAPSVCLGHVVAEVTNGALAVLYAYTAFTVRRLGVASELLRIAGAHGCRCTCYTWAGLPLIRRLGLRFTSPKKGKA